MPTTTKKRKVKGGRIYLLEITRPNYAWVRKIIGQQEQNGYVIENNDCSCKGYHYTGYCKHIQMLQGVPPSRPAPLDEAREIAREALKLLKGDPIVSSTRLKGDIVERNDPVRILRIEEMAKVPRPIRIVFWIDKLAIIIDRLPERDGLPEDRV